MSRTYLVTRTWTESFFLTEGEDFAPGDDIDQAAEQRDFDWDNTEHTNTDVQLWSENRDNFDE